MRAVAAMIAVAGLLQGGCTPVVRGHREARALLAANCAGCHEIPGIGTAQGMVGPPLTGVGSRQLIAGKFANSRANMIRWIAHPQEMLPGNGMPDTGISDRQAALIADYLYALERRL